jgi:GTP-binding protein
MQFIDEALITAGGGDGGNGIVAWRREKYVPNGGPAGGDGGRGGSVILEAQTGVNTLVEFRFKQRFFAQAGDNGGNSNKSGRAADDMIIGVPVGTIVYEVHDDESRRVMADLAEEGARLIIAKGGRGGLGNQHFATSTRQAPTFAEKGEPGVERRIALELKLLADCGLIGLPNAGKSTLLSVVSAARPKIADYPFTTLEPQLGVVRVDADSSFVMVDLPGLIEGASEGAGLGDRFLRHAERTRVLIHLVDGALPLDEVLANKALIERELLAWNAELAAKPTLLVLTKADLPQARETYAELMTQFPDLHFIAAATHEHVRELVLAAWQQIAASPIPGLVAAEPRRISLTPQEPFVLERDGDVYVVSGSRLERLASMTDFTSFEGIGRLERVMAKLGVDKRLHEMGANEGDTVRIAGYEFTWTP